MSHDESQHHDDQARHRAHPWSSHRNAHGSIVLGWGAWLWLGAIYSTVIIGMCFLGATARPYTLSEHRYNGPTVVYTSDGVLLAKLYDEYRVPVRIDEVPPNTIQAILAAEDQNFYHHHGLDARGIARALWYDIRAGHLDQGGSTITQQLVRYELLNDKRSLRRKAREAVLAVRVERTYSKEQILERYLNAVYFGGGAYGLGAAARTYLGKPVSKLTPAESALLASLIRGPEEGNPRNNMALALRRQRAVLATMHRQGWLTDAEYQSALNEKIRIQPRKENTWRSPYVVEAVRQHLLATYGRNDVYNGGMTVYTTIDSTMQRAGERALSRAVNSGRRQRVGNGALVAIDPQTGYIRALVGGTSFWQSPFNRALQAHRQPGSAFKVFVYQAALDAGYTLADAELDAPITIGRWSPHNYGNQYHGYVSLQQALASSLNSVAVRLTAAVGPSAVVNAARHAGITSPLQPNLTIALGTSGVTPLEMARAFATYANEGMVVDPTIIKAVYYKERLLEQASPTPRRQVNVDTAYLLTRGLQAVITSGTGRRAQIGRPAAGKTGTSSDYRDAWFVGYTPQLSTAVWLGNDNYRPMQGVTGGSLPAQAWSEFMRAALRGKPVEDFFAPPTVAEVTVCTVSCKLALPTCPSQRIIEVPISRMPTQVCDVHYWVTRKVCPVSGLLPNATCPHPEARVFAYNEIPTQRCPIDHHQDQTVPTAPNPAPAPSVPTLPENTPPPRTSAPQALQRWIASMWN